MMESETNYITWNVENQYITLDENYRVNPLAPGVQ